MEEDLDNWSSVPDSNELSTESGILDGGTVTYATISSFDLKDFHSALEEEDTRDKEVNTNSSNNLVLYGLDVNPDRRFYRLFGTPDHFDNGEWRLLAYALELRKVYAAFQHSWWQLYSIGDESMHSTNISSELNFFYRSGNQLLSIVYQPCQLRFTQPRQTLLARCDLVYEFTKGFLRDMRYIFSKKHSLPGDMCAHMTPVFKGQCVAYRIGLIAKELPCFNKRKILELDECAAEMLRDFPPQIPVVSDDIGLFEVSNVMVNFYGEEMRNTYYFLRSCIESIFRFGIKDDEDLTKYLQFLLNKLAKEGLEKGMSEVQSLPDLYTEFDTEIMVPNVQLTKELVQTYCECWSKAASLSCEKPSNSEDFLMVYTLRGVEDLLLKAGYFEKVPPVVRSWTNLLFQ